MTVEELAKMIDQTLLKAYATDEDLTRFCEEAKRYGFKMVAINGAPLEVCRKALEGSDVLCGAAIGFPLGQSTIETKVFEAEDAITKGSGEIDYVVNIGKLRSKEYGYVEEEMRQMVAICHKHNVPCKVIFENCYLEDDEKRKLCEIALKVMPDYIKTSTGFGTSGATLEDVKLMKKCVGDRIKIKAAGGIRTTEEALKFIEAGASRIGTSAGPAIIEGYRKISEQEER